MKLIFEKRKCIKIFFKISNMTTVVGWVVHVIIVSAQVQIIGFLDLLGQGIRDFDLGLTIPWSGVLRMKYWVT